MAASRGVEPHGMNRHGSSRPACPRWAGLARMPPPWSQAELVGAQARLGSRVTASDGAAGGSRTPTPVRAPGPRPGVATVTPRPRGGAGGTRTAHSPASCPSRAALGSSAGAPADWMTAPGKVGGEGVEPSRPCGHRVLNPASLPFHQPPEGEDDGRGDRDRTCDHGIWNPALYLAELHPYTMESLAGIEPAMIGVASRRLAVLATGTMMVGPGGIEPPSYRIFSPALLPSELQPHEDGRGEGNRTLGASRPTRFPAERESPTPAPPLHGGERWSRTTHP